MTDRVRPGGVMIGDLRVVRGAVAAAIAIMVVACGGATATSSTPAGADGATRTAASGLVAGASATGDGVAAPGGGARASGDAAESIPAGGAAAGVGWTSADVSQPQELVEPWASAQAPVFCSPCHAGVENGLNAVAAGSGLLVSVGSSFPPSRAAAWSSTDGRTWQQADGLQAPEASLMTAVASSGGRFAAVGGIGPDPGAWVSTDGRRWIRATVERPQSTGDARMAAVAAWQGGFVAGGDVEPGTSERLGVVWHSTDGMTWQVAAEGGPFSGGTVAGILGDGHRLVAVGSRDTADGSSEAAAWYSTDGRAWRLAAAGDSVGAEMRAVAAGGSGFVAVGTAQAGTHAAVWVSTDGLRWTRAPEGDGFTNYSQRVAMSSVSRGPGGFVAVGERDSAGNGSATVWVSADGTAWHRVEDPPSFSGGEMTGVAAWNGAFVAVGATGVPDNWAAAAWIAPPGP